MKYRFSFFIALLIFLFSSQPAFASPLLTEVHPNPLSGPEWVELYNPTTEALLLTGWTLEDQLSSPSIIFNFTTQVIPPGTYLHFELSTQKLNNTSDGVTLKNAQGQIIDTMSYTSSSLGESWSRLNLAAQGWALTLPTPSQPNPQPAALPSPTPSTTPNPSASPHPSPSPNQAYPTTLQASEIMACPSSGESEWLEIFNPSEVAVQLDNWRVKDETSNYRTVSAVVPPQGYGVLTWSSSFLNNAGDSISLLTHTDQALFTIDLGACQKGHSFVFSDDEWQLTTQPTRGTPNLFTRTQITATQPSSPLVTAVDLPVPARPTTTAARTSASSHFQPPHSIPLKLNPPVELPFVSPQPSLTFAPTPDHTRLKWPIASAIMGGAVMLAVNTFGWYYLFKLHHDSVSSSLSQFSVHDPSQSYHFP